MKCVLMATGEAVSWEVLEEKDGFLAGEIAAAHRDKKIQFGFTLLQYETIAMSH